MNRERSFQLLRTAVSLLIALAAAYVIIFLISDTPLEAIRIFTVGPFDSKRHLGNIVEAAIPLIFSGLAMAVVFQASLFNLGAEGIYYISGAVVSLVAIFYSMPAGIHPLVIVILGGVIGAAVMAIPGVLRAKFNASELSTEQATVKSVISKYLTQLEYGTVDLDTTYPEFLDALDKAGINKIIEENQKQLDAWLAAQQ